MRRAAAIIKAQPKSAVVSLSTSGVLVARMPARVMASISRLLYPTAMLAATRSLGAVAIVSAPMRLLNRWFGRTVMRAAATQNEASEQVGWLGRLYAPVGWAKERLKRIKSANRPLFNLVKYLAIAAALYWVFLR